MFCDNVCSLWLLIIYLYFLCYEEFLISTFNCFVSFCMQRILAKMHFLLHVLARMLYAEFMVMLIYIIGLKMFYLMHACSLIL